MAAAKKQQMQLLAHSASFHLESDITLEDLLQSIADAELSPEQRTYTELSGGGQAVAASFLRHPSNQGIGCSISFYEVDARHSTVKTGKGNDDVEIGSAAAGEGHEFLSQNVSIYTQGNRVITCGLRKRANAVCAALTGIAREAGIITGAQAFGLFELPHTQTLSLVEKHGVQKIRFNATPLVRDTAGHLPESFIDSIFSADSSAAAIRRRGDNTIRLEIESKLGRSTARLGGLEQDMNEFLDKVAMNMLEEERVDDFLIVLGNGQKVKNGQLFTSKTVDISRDNTTHNHHEAHREMIQFMSELG